MSKTIKLTKAFANISIWSFYIAGFACLFAAFCGLYNESPLTDLFSHFKVQALLCISWCALLSLKRRKLLMLWCIGIIACGLPIASRYIPCDSAIAAQLANGRAHPLKIVSSNLQGFCPSVKADEAVKEYAAIAADIVALQELNEPAAKLIESKNPDAHRYFLPTPPGSPWGMGILSKYPIIRREAKSFGVYCCPTQICDIQTPSGVLTVINAHPRPPGFDAWDDQMAFVDGAVELVKNAKHPVVLAGDLNSTVWGKVFLKLQGKTGLVDTSQGSGIQPTWPTGLPVMGLAIDHVLVSKPIRVVSHSTLKNIGSDHYPLLVEIALPKDESKASR